MYRILIVEDEQAINSMIRMNLTAVGYETTSAYDGNEALALIEGGAHFDLALLDVMLPGMDGTVLLEPLRERDIPAIFLTARGDLETKLKGCWAARRIIWSNPLRCRSCWCAWIRCCAGGSPRKPPCGAPGT